METHIGTRIKQYRESTGLRQNAFCERAGLRQQTLSTIEAGSSEPSAGVLQKIFLAYPDLSADWVILGVGSMTRDGRTLTPIPAQQPDYTSGQGTVNTVVETLLRDRLADKQVIIDMLTAEVAELRGKPFDSSDQTAGELPTEPNDPRFSAGVAPAPMLRPQVRGFRRKQEAAELS